MTNGRSDSACVLAAVGCPAALLHALNRAAQARGDARLVVLDEWDAASAALAAEADAVIWPLELGLDRMHEAALAMPDASFVVVAQRGADGWMRQALQRGATDALYAADLVSADSAWLDRALALGEARRTQRRTLVEVRTTASQLKARCDRLESDLTRLEAMAWSDPLTGLANRRQLQQRLPQLFAEAVRYSKDLACLMIDLDHFKEVNDRHGHAKGDDILGAAARLISARIRTSDIAVRYGGDEFVVLMPQTSAPTAARVAQRLVEGFDLAVDAIGCAPSAPGLPRCGMSIGVSCLKTSQPIDGDDLLSQADSALLAAKNSGKGRIMVWAPDGRHAEAPRDMGPEPREGAGEQG